MAIFSSSVICWTNRAARRSGAVRASIHALAFASGAVTRDAVAAVDARAAAAGDAMAATPATPSAAASNTDQNLLGANLREDVTIITEPIVKWRRVCGHHEMPRGRSQTAVPPLADVGKRNTHHARSSYHRPQYEID
jgi:hypothetical protein